MTVYDITTQDQLQQLLGQYRVVVVDVYGDFCGPCKAMAPRYEELSKRYASGQIIFTKNNAEHMIFSDVTGLPTILFFLEGQLFHRVLGANVKEIEETIMKAIGSTGSTQSKQPIPPQQPTHTQRSARPDGQPMENLVNMGITHKKSQSQYKKYSDI